ncbi:MAG: ATP-binding protein, partial [Aquincola sp.]|nr:ATP-binding protein [Aquincola sp.]
MSEGMLYWLAFAIVEHLSAPQVLLIEEPENGLHPSRIREVVRILRKISESTQVILATHSPLVINELQPEDRFLTLSGAQCSRATYRKTTIDAPAVDGSFARLESYHAVAQGGRRPSPL